MYETNKMTLIPYLNYVGALLSLSNLSFIGCDQQFLKMKHFAIQALSMIQLFEETDNFPTLITLEQTKRQTSSKNHPKL